MDFHDLLRHPPWLHVGRDGNPVAWRASDKLLRYLHATLTEGDATLETGAGITTLIFAMKRCRHTVVVPDEALIGRVQRWCEENGVPTDTLTFQPFRSENLLPRLEPTPLDLVLIDGAHGFPMPLLDWFYAGRRLRPGGALIVDDLQIWTSRVLYDFLSREPQWRIDHKASFGFFAATRVSSGPVGEWLDQPFVRRRSFTVASGSMTRRAIGAFSVGANLASGALSLARRRDFGEMRYRAATVMGRQLSPPHPARARAGGPAPSQPDAPAGAEDPRGRRVPLSAALTAGPAGRGPARVRSSACGPRQRGRPIQAGPGWRQRR